mmetsp:Transcript_31430/g.74135  ORF Transcript_31430/g.74135 Transcript_31430/m.74135 type:complete len:122 (-) Transcript_31430:351-716(-)
MDLPPPAKRADPAVFVVLPVLTADPLFFSQPVALQPVYPIPVFGGRVILLHLASSGRTFLLCTTYSTARAGQSVGRISLTVANSKLFSLRVAPLSHLAESSECAQPCPRPMVNSRALVAFP